MRWWEKAAVYFGLRAGHGEQPIRLKLRSWRFVAQCLFTLVLMLLCALALRAVGVSHEAASWLGIALGAFVAGLFAPRVLQYQR